MERYLRIAGPAAIAGMVLSILVGAISGIPFGTVVLRGIVSAIVFGGGAAGLVIVAERTLPGLVGNDVDGAAPTERRADGVTMDEPPAAGSQLNIVVEDEDEEDLPREPQTAENRGNASAAAAASGEGPESDDAEVDDGILEPVEGLEPIAASNPSEAGRSESPPSESSASQDESAPEERPAFEADQTVGGQAEDGENYFDGTSDDEEESVEELVEEVEEQSAENAEALMNEAIAEEKYGGGVEIDDTVLDEMPDIGSFSGSFVGSSPSDSEDDSSIADPFASESGGTRRRGGAEKLSDDPTIVAKALQTMLSRDEKE